MSSPRWLAVAMLAFWAVSAPAPVAAQGLNRPAQIPELLDGPRLQIVSPDGKPVTGPIETWIWLLGNDHRAAAWEEIKKAGGAIMPALPPNTDRAIVTRAIVEVRCAEAGWASVSLNGWPDAEVPVTLAPGGSIVGRAVDQVGKPIGEAHVYLFHRRPGLNAVGIRDRRDTVTSADGSFTITALFPGSYDVWGRPPADTPVLYQSVTVTAAPIQVVLKPATGEELTLVRRDWGGHTPDSSASIIRQVFPEALPELKPISGIVLDAETHQPMPGVRLNLDDRYVGDPVTLKPRPAAHLGPAGLFFCDLDTAVSSPEGRFSLLAPGVGSYHLNANERGYASTQAAIGVAVGEPQPMTISLQRMFGALTLSVLDTQGKPVPMPRAAAPWPWPGGRVLMETGFPEVWIWSLGPWKNADLREYGAHWSRDGLLDVRSWDWFTFGKGSRSVIEVRLPGVGEGSAFVNGGTQEPVEIRLGEGGSIHGVALDTRGKPVPNHSIEARRIVNPTNPNPGGSAYGTTSPSGQFELSCLPPGTYGLRLADAKDKLFRLVDVKDNKVQVVLRQNDPLSVRMDNGGDYSGWVSYWEVAERVDPDMARSLPSVSGRLVDSATGAPVSDIQVSLDADAKWRPTYEGQWGPDCQDRAITGPDGSFTLKAPPGSYALAVDDPEWYPLTKVVALQTGVTTETERLTRLPAMTFALRGPDGRPLAPGPVTASVWLATGGQVRLCTDVNHPLEVGTEGMLSIPIPVWRSQTYGHPVTLAPGAPVQVIFRVQRAGSGSASLTMDHWPTGAVKVRLKAEG